MDAFQQGQAQQQTVQVRVQVIDMNSFTLDLQVPTYLPARDLTQRIARDAGLDAYWDDGRRRLYWLRARGRLLADDEKLEDLGVVNNELVYLLPEPPAGSGVLEQPPDYPEARGYSAKGTFTLLGGITWVLLWALAWAAALSIERSMGTVLLPGMAMGALCVSFARHAWGGKGSNVRVPVTGLVLFMLCLILAFAAPLLFSGVEFRTLYVESVAGLILGMVGVFTAWLAWWGAVEPLPEIEEQAQTEALQAAVAVVQCGICGLDVTTDVREECKYRCGRYFHSGCYKARVSVYRGDPNLCPICNARVA